MRNISLYLILMVCVSPGVLFFESIDLWIRLFLLGYFWFFVGLTNTHLKYLLGIIDRQEKIIEDDYNVD